VKRYSKIVVTAIIIANIVFAAAVLTVFWHTGAEPGVLVGAWFAFTTGELWALAKIKCVESGGKTQKEEVEE
jgi:hypothetical protein